MLHKKFTLTFVLAFLTALICSAQNSLDFDGSNDYVEVPLPTPLNSIDPIQFTFEAWIQSSWSSSDHPMIFSNRQQISPGVFDGVTFFLHKARPAFPTVKLLAIQLDNRNYYFQNNGGVGDILDGNCHHVAIMKEGNILVFMIDGQQIGQTTIHPSTPNPTIASAVPMWIGDDPPVIPFTTAFEGKITDVRIWDRAKNWPEVAADMNTWMPPGTPNLVASYEMISGAGQDAFDHSGNGFHGELGSTPLADANDPLWANMPCHPYKSIVLDTEEQALNSLEDDILIYPNPAKEYLEIDLSDSFEKTKLEVIDIVGKTVLRLQYEEQQTIRINLEELTPGTYILSLENENGQRSMKKFIKE